MSAQHLIELEAAGAFRPRFQFAYLAQDHVPFDELTGETRYEGRALAAVQEEAGCVSVVAPVGAGKSSMIAYVCSQLPEECAAIRVPVAALDDPGDVKVFAGTILRSALRETKSELRPYQREAVEKAGGDTYRRAPKETGIRGGKIGGGVIPAELQVEIGGLVDEYEREALTVDRLHGVERLLDIFAERGLRPVFVIEDTDAVVGDDDAETFFAGPVRILAKELDAASLLAVQTHRIKTPAYADLRTGLVETTLPDPPDKPVAITSVLERRVDRAGADVPIADLISDEGVGALVTFFDETEGSFRHVLAAVSAALEHAVPEQPDRLEASHIKYGIQAWTTANSTAARS